MTHRSAIAFPLPVLKALSKSTQSGRKIIRNLKWSEDKKSIKFTSEIYNLPS